MQDLIVSKEELDFQITLSGTYWRDPPKYQIFVDDQLMAEGQISHTSSRFGLPDETMTRLEKTNSFEVIRFKAELGPGDHALIIRLPEKDPNDTVVRDGKITHDLLLNVERIVIDDMDLDSFMNTKSVYVLDQEQVHNGESVVQIKQCKNLGYPGNWRLDFKMPFYMWMLDLL